MELLIRTLACVAVACLISTRAALGAIAFTDSTFKDSNWNVVPLESGNGGTAYSWQDVYQISGDSYRRVSLSVDSGPSFVCSFHQAVDAVVDPSTSGAPAYIDFGMEICNLSGWMDRARFGPAVRQNGKVYVAGPCPWVSGTGIGWIKLSMTRLKASDFQLAAGPDSPLDWRQHPDFSAGAAPLEFGFAWWGESQDLPFEFSSAVDNWTLTVHTSSGTIPGSKALQDGAMVTNITGVVTAAFDGAFYVQADRPAVGIRVEKPGHGLTPGTVVAVSGAMGTNPNAERCIVNAQVTEIGVGVPRPIMMRLNALGGSDMDYDPYTGAGQRGIPGSLGPNNIGLLVKFYGKAYRIPGETQYFRISDGGQVTPIVALPEGYPLPADGETVVVTGISSCVWGFSPVDGSVALESRLLATGIDYH